MRSPRCSLIVPVHNGLDHLEPMLASLRDCTPGGLFELILSDDGCGEETRGFSKAQVGWAKVHFSLESQSFASACNAGAALAESVAKDVFAHTDDRECALSRAA